MMRTLTFLMLLSVGLVSCELTNRDYSIEGEPSFMGITPPEESGATFVEMDGWRMEGNALNVTRDQSKRQVLRAAVQGGAQLRSLKVPLHSQVATTGAADAIYYDSFRGRFELVGDPVIEQGAQTTRKVGSGARLMMHRDGKIVIERESSLVGSSSGDDDGSDRADG